MTRPLAALACDYDGTLATDGRVADSTLHSLRRLRRTGCRLILVTGRQLDDLRSTFFYVGLFDRLVVENGAILHTPSTGTTCRLADPPPEAFVSALRERGVAPIAAGEVIVATSDRHLQAVRETIADLQLRLQLFVNKGALMVVPDGVDKGVGLAAALAELRLPRECCIGIGDAENDFELLSACGLGVAVANAVDALKEKSDLVTRRPFGDGVSEVVDLLIDRGLEAEGLGLGNPPAR